MVRYDLGSVFTACRARGLSVGVRLLLGLGLLGVAWGCTRGGRGAHDEAAPAEPSGEIRVARPAALASKLLEGTSWQGQAALFIDKMNSDYLRYADLKAPVDFAMLRDGRRAMSLALKPWEATEAYLGGSFEEVAPGVYRMRAAPCQVGPSAEAGPGRLICATDVATLEQLDGYLRWSRAAQRSVGGSSRAARRVSAVPVSPGRGASPTPRSCERSRATTRRWISSS